MRRVSGAEPHPSCAVVLWRTGVVGLAPQTTRMTERANTMKTYILRDPKAVQPQKSANNPPVIPLLQAAEQRQRIAHGAGRGLASGGTSLGKHRTESDSIIVLELVSK